MEPFSWECPHCNRATTITKNDCEISETYKFLEKIETQSTKGINVEIMIIQCPNPECCKHTTYVTEYSATKRIEDGWRIVNIKENKHLQFYPEKKIKNYPEYVPSVIISDYREAYLICDVSPKASATLSRRCLQGILRDFWNVKPKRLFDEINEIKDKIDPITWEAIDSTRKIGNIGAHMEKDINLIIDVDPDEAKLLISLIETLIENWYIVSHEKEERLKKIKRIADEKK